LYTGSLFRMKRRYAEKRTRAKDDDWYIVSAKLGLLENDETVAPYDMKMADYRWFDRAAWPLVVAHELINYLAYYHPTMDHSWMRKHVVIEILAGVDYYDRLSKVLRAIGFKVEIPMQGMAQGEQMAFLKQALEPQAA